MAVHRGFANERTTMLPGTDEHDSTPKMRLQIMACGDALMPEVSACVIDRADGSIGRAADNDLVLPDDEGVISRVHARVEYADGRYYLVDQSTNGTSLGSAGHPLPSGQRHLLNDGDQLLIGAYTIGVDLGRDQGADSSMLSSERLIDLDHPRTEPDPFGATADGANPLSEVDGWSSGVQRPDWFPAGEEPVSPSTEREQAPPAPARTPPLQQHMPAPRGQVPLPEPAPDAPGPQGSDRVPTGYVPFADQFDDFPPTLLNDEETPAEVPPPGPVPADLPPPVEPQTRPGERPAHAATPVAGPGAAVGDSALMEAFLRGLNLPSVRIPDAQAVAFMEQAGELVGESVQGLIDMLRLRAEFKHEFYVPATSISPVANNVYKYSVNAADAISRWMADGEQGAYLGPGDSTRQSFQDLAAHQLALIAGMEAAVSALLGRFAPDALEERIGKATVLEGMLPQVRRARMWEAFECEYRQIADQAAEDFQEILGQHFARAYTEQIKRLAQVGFGGKGQDNEQS